MSQTVGLTGYAGSGKDTAAQGLLDLGWERRAFADPLKECVYLLNPIISSQRTDTHFQVVDGMGSQGSGPEIQHLRLAAAVDAVGWDEAKKHGEVRRLLQVFGTEVVRNHFGANAWVEHARGTLLPGVDYVFTDCRFPNEVEMIHQSGGVVVRIARPGVEAVNAHVSDDISHLLSDYVLVNDSTPEELQRKLCELVGAE